MRVNHIIPGSSHRLMLNFEIANVLVHLFADPARYIGIIGSEVPSPRQSSMPSTPTRSRKSAVPTFYYVVFGIIEPLVTLASLLEGIFDPWKVCISARVWT